MGKFEARNPKSETNSNDQKYKIQNKFHSDSGFWNFQILGPSLFWISSFGFGFKVCFEFRASDFGFSCVTVRHITVTLER